MAQVAPIIATIGAVAAKIAPVLSVISAVKTTHSLLSKPKGISAARPTNPQDSSIAIAQKNMDDGFANYMTGLASTAPGYVSRYRNQEGVRKSYESFIDRRKSENA